MKEGIKIKLYHFTISFILIAITFLIITDIRTNNLNAVVNNKKEIDRYIDTAIDDAVIRLIEVGENNMISINKEKAIESFMTSLYSSFNILSNQEKQKELSLYIPVIVVTLEDGYYIYYYDEYKDVDQHTYAIARWSEKLPYYYEDEHFIYGFTLGDNISILDKSGLLDGSGKQKVYEMNFNEMRENYSSVISSPDHFLLNNEKFNTVRKTIIADLIESTMAYYTSHHNKIASNYGITYNFSLPPISNNEWMPYLDDWGIFIVFQGYPYGNEAGEVYNRFASAGAKISKDKLYYIEQVDWHLVYHRASCTKVNEESILYSTEPYLTIGECVREGAYACPECNTTGISVPEYSVH